MEVVADMQQQDVVVEVLVMNTTIETVMAQDVVDEWDLEQWDVVEECWKDDM